MDIEPQFKHLFQAAYDYATRGIPVFPLHGITDADSGCTCGRACGRAGKHPRIMEWPKRATTDRSQVRKWWRMWPDSNVGMPTGAPSGLVVLDFDGRPGQDLADAHGVEEDPATPLSITGHGTHAFYRWPGVPLHSSVGALPGLDIRADGAVAILPPSKHVLGHAYTWIRPLTDPRAVPHIPRWAPISRSGSRKPPRPLPLRPPARVVETVGYVLQNVARAKPGTRNNTLNHEAYFLASFVTAGAWSEEKYYANLRRAGLNCGLELDEVDRTIDSALSARRRGGGGWGRGGFRSLHGGF